MSSVDLEPFSFPNWYPTFAAWSIESISIPIPPEILSYLKIGFFVLPKEALPEATESLSINYHHHIHASEDDTEPLELPTFPSFSAKLTEAMNTLGGAVFLKLNWSAPKDATWATANHTLKCTTLEEIYFLLKSSEIVDKDLSYEFKNDPTYSESQFCVVLKRWLDIDLGCEFRCFTVENRIVGISQRYCSTYYRYIEENKDDIIQEIVKFFKNNVRFKFPVATYTLDIVRQEENNILIVDFNPLVQELTNLLLFDWKEFNITSDHDIKSETESLYETDDDFDDKPVFHYVGVDSGCLSRQPSLSASSIHLDSMLKLNLKKRRCGLLRILVPNLNELTAIANHQGGQGPSPSSRQDDQQQPPDENENEVQTIISSMCDDPYT